MRVLHTAFMTASEPGILRQMSWEQQAADELGLHWDSRLCIPASEISNPNKVLVPLEVAESRLPGKLKRVGQWYSLRKSYIQWIKQVASDYDVLLLRYNIADPLWASGLKGLPIPYYTVHHSKEGEEIFSAGKSSKLYVKSWIESLSARLAFSSAAGFVSVTNEIQEYEKKRQSSPLKCTVYPNGIWVSGDEFAMPDLRSEADPPQILFVASHFAPWHGLDRLLRAVRKSKANFTLHLVGKLSPADMAVASKDRRIIIHGYMTSDQISELSSRCWLGLSSFALDRIGMEQACTLKVREYLSNGLCVYAGYQDVFPESFLYYKKGPAHMDAILAFATKVRFAPRKKVAQAATPYIAKKNLLSDLSDWMKVAESKDLA